MTKHSYLQPYVGFYKKKKKKVFMYTNYNAIWKYCNPTT